MPREREIKMMAMTCLVPKLSLLSLTGSLLWIREVRVANTTGGWARDKAMTTKMKIKT
jgi:hypothetical protein